MQQQQPADDDNADNHDDDVYDGCDDDMMVAMAMKLLAIMMKPTAGVARTTATSG